MRRKMLIDTLHVLPLALTVQLTIAAAGLGAVFIFALTAVVMTDPTPSDVVLRGLGTLAPNLPLLLAFLAGVLGTFAIKLVDGAIAATSPLPVGTRVAWVVGILLGPSLVAQVFWWAVARRTFFASREPNLPEPAANRSDDVFPMPPCDDEWEQARAWVDHRPASVTATPAPGEQAQCFAAS